MIKNVNIQVHVLKLKGDTNISTKLSAMTIPDQFEQNINKYKELTNNVYYIVKTRDLINLQNMETIPIFSVFLNSTTIYRVSHLNMDLPPVNQ